MQKCLDYLKNNHQTPHIIDPIKILPKQKEKVSKTQDIKIL